MDWLTLWPLLAAACFLGTGAAVFWQTADEPSRWLWQQNLHLLSGVLAALAFFSVGMVQRQYDLKKPLTYASGRIEGTPYVALRSHTVQFNLRTNAGDIISLHAQDSSEFSGSGESMTVGYVKRSGLVMQADISGRFPSHYSNNLLEPNPWMICALVALLGGASARNGFAKTFVRKSSRGTIGDTVAEEFTPEHLQVRWNVIDTPDGERLSSSQSVEDRSSTS